MDCVRPYVFTYLHLLTSEAASERLVNFRQTDFSQPSFSGVDAIRNNGKCYIFL